MTAKTERALWLGALAFFLILDIGLVAGLFGLFDRNQQGFGTALPQGPAVFETSLQDRISSTDTSLTLVSGTVRGSTALSGYNCFTIDEGRTDMEYVCGTVSGTAVSSLERGIDPVTATTTNSTVKFAHRKGANVKVTDFPLIQRLRHQNNGNDTFPNPLTYASHPCSVSSASTTICDKNYSDNLVSVGASPGSNSVAGIFLTATGAQAGSSTPTGDYNAVTYNYVLPASIATDTPNSATRASRVLLSDLTGYLKQGWLNLTEAFTWAGAQTWNAQTNVFTHTSPRVGIGTSTPYAPLSVVGQIVGSYFTATSTTATSTLPSLQVTGSATTTNLTVSGTCFNCATNGYTQTTGTFDLNGGSPSTGSGSVACAAGKKVVGGGYSGVQVIGGTLLSQVDSYPSDSTHWAVAVRSVNGSTATITMYAICVNQ